MNWVVDGLIFFAGWGLGYLVQKNMGVKEGNNSPTSHRELAQAKFELDQQRQEMADYFEQSREIMAQLGQDLDKANKFWNDSASTLLGEGKVVPLTPPNCFNPDSPQESAPNDYVQGSHGIIGEQQKVANG